MFIPGLVSITFRKRSPAAIIELVGRSGLQAIEWGGDVHVPHGDVATAKVVGQATRDAGLTVASYGSYYRVGDNPEFSFASALETAAALGAPLIRVWAGRKGSQAATPDERKKVADDALRIAERAAAVDIKVAFEFHGNSLTDTTESALDLLRKARHANLFSYWQPLCGWSQEAYESSLAAMTPQLVALHVFQWGDGGERLALADGESRWAPFFRHLTTARPETQLPTLIEFVRGDAPEAFMEDARALLKWVG